MAPDADMVQFSRHATCPLCDGEALIDKFKVSGFTICKCQDCSLVMVRERLTQEQLSPYYQTLDDDYVYADPVNVANLNYYFNNAKKLIEEKLPKGRILDVGCSAGIFLDVMSGWERHGIEFPSAVANHARRTYGDNIHLGSLEDYPLKEGYFDCVTLFDVLDHMSDPISALEKCNRLLRPGGLLVVKVHDISCLYARLSGKTFYAIIPPYHLFYYNRQTLSALTMKTGFKLVEARHMAHILLLKTIPYRLARNDVKSFFYKLYEVLDKAFIGKFRVKKNLHDLITIFTIKQ